MNRGTVMSLNKKSAVVLTPDGQFVQIKRLAHYKVGEEITNFVATRSNPRIRQRIFQTGMFTSALLLLLIGLIMFRTPPVVAYVTMDVNPSIELGIDSEEKVRQLRAVNEDAEAIIAGMKFRGETLESVMSELARKLVEDQFLTPEDGDVIIATVPMKALEEQWEEHIAQTMTQILSEATQQEYPEQNVDLDVTSLSLPVEVRDEAEAKGISSGKMAFWLVSESQGHELSLDTLKEQSLKKIAASWGEDSVNQVMRGYDQKQDDKKDDGKADQKDDNKDDNKVDNKDENKGDKHDEKKNNKQDDDNKGDKVDDEKVDKKDDMKTDNKFEQKDGKREGNKDDNKDKYKDEKGNEKQKKKEEEKVDEKDANEDKDHSSKRMDKAESWKKLLNKAKNEAENEGKNKGKNPDRNVR